MTEVPKGDRGRVDEAPGLTAASGQGRGGAGTGSGGLGTDPPLRTASDPGPPLAPCGQIRADSHCFPAPVCSYFTSPELPAGNQRMFPSPF